MNNIKKAFKAKSALRMAGGGMVCGPGTGTSDSVPVMASKGEYVLPADTVQAIGKHNLDGLRHVTHAPVKMADGGLVDDALNYAKQGASKLRGMFNGSTPAIEPAVSAPAAPVAPQAIPEPAAGYTRNAAGTITAAEPAVTAAAPSKLRALANGAAGKLIGGIAAGQAIGDSADPDSTARYAQRFGVSEPTGDGSVGDIAKFVGLRAGGFASDLGNRLTGGLASKLYADTPTNAPAATPLTPITPAPVPAAATTDVPATTLRDPSASSPAVPTISGASVQSSAPGSLRARQNSQQLDDRGYVPADGTGIMRNDTTGATTEFSRAQVPATPRQGIVQDPVERAIQDVKNAHAGGNLDNIVASRAALKAAISNKGLNQENKRIDLDYNAKVANNKLAVLQMSNALMEKNGERNIDKLKALSTTLGKDGVAVFDPAKYEQHQRQLSATFGKYGLDARHIDPQTIDEYLNSADKKAYVDKYHDTILSRIKQFVGAEAPAGTSNDLSKYGLRAQASGKQYSEGILNNFERSQTGEVPHAVVTGKTGIVNTSPTNLDQEDLSNTQFKRDQKRLRDQGAR